MYVCYELQTNKIT